MATTIDTVKVVVTADNTDAIKGLKATQTQTESLKSTMVKAAAVIGGAAGAVAIIKSFAKMAAAAEDAFQIQEKAISGLNAALISTGQYSESVSQEIQSFASEMQNLTTVGDEATLALIQTALNMGLTAEESKTATTQAIAMSEAYGVGLDTALRATANSTLGNYDALSRYLPAIKNATTEAEKAEIVNTQLAAAFDIATANAKTSLGVQTQLENSYGDLKETIGSVISQALTPYRTNLKKEVESINLSIQAHLLRKKAIAGNATLIEDLTLKQIEQQKAEEALAQALLNVDNAENQVLDTRYLSEAQISRIEAAKAAALKKAELTITALEDELTLRKLGTAAAQKALDAEQKLTEANILAAQGVITLTENTEDNTASTDLNTEAAFRNLSALTEYEAQVYKNEYAHRKFTETVEDDIEDQISLYEELRDVGLAGIVSGYEAIGEAIASGTLSMSTFGDVATEALSSILTALGSELAARSIASLLIGDLAGASIAAAGSVAAFAASSVASAAFAEGGSFTTNGSQNILVGDNPGGIEKVTVEPVSSAGANESTVSGSGSYYLVIDGDPIKAKIQSYINNGQLRSSKGGRI
jgi:hypothetical protein